MPFSRRILHHGPNPESAPQLLSLTAVRSCWFELHRQGGCGSGEIILSDAFDLRDQVEIGDWISFEASAGDRWYLGRVEERRAEVPARIRLRLEGMAIELNEIFPGGFGSAADGRKPQVFGATEQFSLDPDYHLQTWNPAVGADDVVRLLLTQGFPANCHIQYIPELVEAPARAAPVTSLKVRGEESVRSLLKDLALRAQGASWGVDAQGRFFFLQPRDELLASYREGRDLTALEETRDLDFLFNRILLTGDYVYDRLIQSDDKARRSYRWRGNYVEPGSQAQFGDRRIRLWLPWIRTQSDSLAFAREFFRKYSQPGSRYLIETTGQFSLPLPWEGTVRIEDHLGVPLTTSRIETLRVSFDHVPCFRMELGPEDPRTLWPEPPQDERWELPNSPPQAGGIVSIPSIGLSAGPIGGNSGGGGGGGIQDSGDSAGLSFGSENSSGSAGSMGSIAPSGPASTGSIGSSSPASTGSMASSGPASTASAGSSGSMWSSDMPPLPSAPHSDFSSLVSIASSESGSSAPESQSVPVSYASSIPPILPSDSSPPPTGPSWYSSETPPPSLPPDSTDPWPSENPSSADSSNPESHVGTHSEIHNTFLHWT